MSEIQKWSDEAMFKAEPLKASDGPKVFLLAGTPDPLGAVAAMSKMYKGEVVRDMAGVTDEEREEYLAQILKTKLKAPLEAVKVHFMVEGVTRSFTHQMVRQRTAAYAQESLRFAVKEDMSEGVALPPSLMGTRSTDQIIEDQDDGHHHVSDQTRAFLPVEEKMRLIWDHVVEVVSDGYNDLVNMGMPAEDARGLLPHNVTTRLNYVTDIRALQDHAGNRLCTQAQFEWRLVWVKIIEAMRGYCTNAAHSDASGHPWEHGKKCDNWQWDALADVFRPVCYLTGKCEFMANFDRHCSIRERVEENHRHGVPSHKWGEGAVVNINGEEARIDPIRPQEWLLDPSAARRA